jgi:hypothetical protein
MIRSQNLRGIWQTPYGKWAACIRINNRTKHLGCFTTKEQAAAAFDSAARLKDGVNAVCNYDGPEDAALAISEANEYNVLLHAGELELITQGRASRRRQGRASRRHQGRDSRRRQGRASRRRQGRASRRAPGAS